MLLPICWFVSCRIYIIYLKAEVFVFARFFKIFVYQLVFYHKLLGFMKSRDHVFFRFFSFFLSCFFHSLSSSSLAISFISQRWMCNDFVGFRVPGNGNFVPASSPFFDSISDVVSKFQVILTFQLFI